MLTQPTRQENRKISFTRKPRGDAGFFLARGGEPFAVVAAKLLDMLSEERKQAILQHIEPIPVVRNLRFQIEAMDEGICRAIVPKDDRFDGAYGAYHGGLLATAADSIACLAIWTVLGPDALLTTSDLNIRYLAPCFSDVTVEARTIKVGRTLCPVEVNIHDEAGTHIAIAQVTYFRIEAPVKRA